MEFSQRNIIDVFERITSVDYKLKIHFDSYLREEYKDNLTERFDYIDISEISRFIIEEFKLGQTNSFDPFFIQVEIVLLDCDDYVNDLIVIGLFEGIQNICDRDIDYYTKFNKWLKPLSKHKWAKLIDSWEGEDWRENIDCVVQK